MLALFCVLAGILGAQTATAPFVKPCAPGDHDCFVSSAQAAVPILAVGVPELGIKPIDPMFLEYVKSEQSGLSLVLKNTTVTGLKDCNVDNIKHDLAKSKQIITVRCSVVLKGDYIISGRLMILPVTGEGKHVITIRDIVIKAYVNLGQKEEDGTNHWFISSWRHLFQVKTSTTFYFENLFNGNKILADAVLQFANSNWREVMNEVAGPIVEAIVSKVVDSVKSLYKAVPASELALE